MANKNSVLIVDDENTNLFTLESILSLDYSIYSAMNGPKALEIAFNYIPDIILLDIVMPEMDGFEVLVKLKSSEKTKNIPVIIITGLEGVENEEKGLALKAADFIYKPFSPLVVKARVEHQIQFVNQIRALEKFAEYQISIAAADEKSKFFARMSHEMRTPLNAVIGLADLTLESNSLSNEVRENIEYISNAGTSLLELVNDILDISKVESGMFELRPGEYEIPEIISDVITQCIMWKGEKPIDFILNIDENIPKVLLGDDLRLKQILNNLLSNAFKYTRKGTVELNIGRKVIDRINDDSAPGYAGNIMLIASVRDTGIGIHSKVRDKLFTEYVQIDVHSNREMIGTGLGLSITKMIVELMHGTFEVESEHGKGSVFTVNLPQGFSNNEVIGREAVDKLKNFQYRSRKRKSSLQRIDLSYAKVLVVDDLFINIQIAIGMMKPYRMYIDYAVSGKQAIEAIRDEKVIYDAVFMDHMMPEMDGIEAVRIIREIGTDYARNIPIIAFTANAISGTEEMLLSKGFQAFISKPVDSISLDAVLNEWVRNEKLEKNILKKQFDLEGEKIHDRRFDTERRSGLADRRVQLDRRLISGEKYLDIEKSLERFYGNREIYNEIIRSYSVTAGELIKTIKEVTNETLPDYVITVHGLKSSSRGIGAEAVGDMAESLEYAAKESDLDFIKAKNPAFIKSVSSLILEIDEILRNKN